MGTIGDSPLPVPPPPLPDVDVEWKLDGAAQTEAQKDADSTATIKVSAKLIVGSRAARIKELTCTNYNDKYFSDRFPPPAGTSPAPATGPTSAPTSGTSPDLTFEKKVLRCKFHLEYETEFVNRNPLKEKFKVTLDPMCAAINKLAKIKGEDLFQEFTIELIPCTLQLFDPSPKALGDSNKGYNDNTLVRARVVRKKDKGAPISQDIGISGDDIKEDPECDPSEKLWLEFVLKCPKRRPWLDETLHKMAHSAWYANPGSKVKVIKWNGAHFENGVRKTTLPFDSSDDWIADKHRLSWKGSISPAPGATPVDQLRTKKKNESHLIDCKGINTKGFLEFRILSGSPDGLDYNHSRFFGISGRLGWEPFFDLRTVNCTKYGTPQNEPQSLGKVGLDTNARVEFISWYNTKPNVDDTTNWKECGRNTVEVLVPDIANNGEVPANAKDWFLKHSCHESRAIWLSRHNPIAPNGLSHEFNVNSLTKLMGNFRRRLWGAHPNYFCHDLAWRMPCDRFRVDLKGKQSIYWDKLYDEARKLEECKKYGFELIKSGYAQENDIVVFSKNSGDMASHSNVVIENPWVTRKTLLNKDVQNGIFESTEDDDDDFIKRYGSLKHTFFRRRKCHRCTNDLTGLESECPSCGPAPPNTPGTPDWNTPRFTP
jgi:hypothetical protein